MKKMFEVKVPDAYMFLLRFLSAKRLKLHAYESVLKVWETRMELCKVLDKADLEKQEDLKRI